MQSHFNPRSPHGERPVWGASAGLQCLFQSTLPARGATVMLLSVLPAPAISIHAPRTGSDRRKKSSSRTRWNFNPRSPHGERRMYGLTGKVVRDISIHAPRTGSDARARAQAPAQPHFNPRSPHGERHSPPRKWRVERYFNPRSPHGERRRPSKWRNITMLFQSTLPARGATPSRV